MYSGSTPSDCDPSSLLLIVNTVCFVLDGAPDVGWLLFGVVCVAGCLLVVVCFTCELIRGCKNQNSLSPGIEPVGRVDDSNEENSSPEHTTVHDTDPDHEMEMVLPSSSTSKYYQ